MSAPTGAPFGLVVVTLFEAFFRGPLETSLLGKAVARGDLVVTFVNPRDFASDRHRTVDDTPYGGGVGMVLKPGPLVSAIERARSLQPEAPVILLSPQGERLSAPLVGDLASLPGLILVCGRYEGFDERIRSFVDRELSIGDYVLSGGEPAAVVVIDALSRHLEGVLGNRESVVRESFAEGLLEYPQYTRPAVFRGMAVPEVLRSGNHARIDAWRREQARARTHNRRPDLLQLAEADDSGGREAAAANESTRDQGGSAAPDSREH